MSIVPRNRWCTVPQASWWRPSRMRLPAAEVWLHHGAAGTSSTATANGYAAYHIRTKNWGEIGYSFVIAGGRVLEGRGAGVEGAHTYGRNGVSHGICVAGDYGSRQPSTEDLDALVWLLKHGHQEGWWNRPVFTGGHRDAPGASTSCPGDRLQQAIPDINRRASAPEPEDQMVAEWAKAAWGKLTRRGVLDGTRPKDPITREELAVVLDRLGLADVDADRLRFLDEMVVQLEHLDPPTNPRWALTLVRDHREG